MRAILNCNSSRDYLHNRPQSYQQRCDCLGNPHLPHLCQIIQTTFRHRIAAFMSPPLDQLHLATPLLAHVELQSTSLRGLFGEVNICFSAIELPWSAGGAVLQERPPHTEGVIMSLFGNQTYCTAIKCAWHFDLLIEWDIRSPFKWLLQLRVLLSLRNMARFLMSHTFIQRNRSDPIINGVILRVVYCVDKEMINILFHVKNRNVYPFWNVAVKYFLARRIDSTNLIICSQPIWINYGHFYCSGLIDL